MPEGLRGGTQTFWRNWGAGPPGQLLIHCTLANSGSWAGLVDRLGRPAVAFDLPGHGKSGPRDAGVDYQDQCLQVAADFVDGPMDIIGHSFGATVALRLALEQPAKVRRLVLIEPVLFAAARGTALFDAYRARLQPFNDAIMARNPMLAARIFTGIWGTGAAWEDIPEAQRQSMAEQIHLIPTQDAALLDDRGGLLRPGGLEALKTPVLLMEGGKSPAIIGAINVGLSARLRDVQRHVVDGAGHMLPITHPDDCAAVIGPFLRA